MCSRMSIIAFLYAARSAVQELLLADGIGTFDVAVQEEIRQCGAYCDGDYDGRGFDAAAQAGEEAAGIDAADIQQGEQQPVEEYTRNQRDDSRNLQQYDRGIENVACPQSEDAQHGRSEAGGCSLAHIKLQHAEIAQADGDAGTGPDDQQQALRDIEHQAEANRGDEGCDGMRKVDAVRRDGQRGEIRHIAEADCRHDAEGHAADDEKSINGPCRAGNDIAVEHIVDRVDQRNSRHDEQGTGNKRMPRC